MDSAMKYLWLSLMVFLAGCMPAEAGLLTRADQGATITVTAQASSTTVTCEWGEIHSNEGASAQVTLTLPTAAAGSRCSFVVQDADGLEVKAATGDTININGLVSGAAGSFASTVVGATLDVVAINATEWIATTSTPRRQVIEDRTISGSASTGETFSSIPQTFDTLIFQIDAVSDGAVEVDALAFYVNGDSASGHYIRQNNGAGNATNDSAETADYYVATITGANSVGGNLIYGTARITVPRYTETANQKFWHSTWMDVQNATYLDNLAITAYRDTAGSGALTDAITSATVVANTGDIEVGSRLVLIGEHAAIWVLQ